MVRRAGANGSPIWFDKLTMSGNTKLLSPLSLSHFDKLRTGLSRDSYPGYFPEFLDRLLVQLPQG